MTGFLFVLGELLRSLRGRSAALIGASFVLVLFFALAFSGLVLLGGGASSTSPLRLGRTELLVHFSAGADSGSIQAMYTRLIERSDVRSVRLLLNDGEAALRVRTVGSAPSASLLEELRAAQGIASVDAPTHVAFFLSDASIRLGLLVALALFFLGGLLCARTGFKELLSSFAEEIELLRASGVSESTIQGPLVAVGFLVGLTASLLVITLVSLSHLVVVAHPQVVPAAVTGILEPRRVLTACLLVLPLGAFVGVLAGALGAALAGSRNLEP